MTQRWTVRSAAGRAREVMAREGARSLAWRVVGELFYRRMILMEYSLRAPPAEVTGAEDVQFAALEPGGIEEYARFRPDTPAAEVAARLSRGDECLLARRGGVIVLACWAAVTPVWIEYLGRRLELADDQAMLYDFYALPEARGLNLYRAHITAMFRHWDGHPRHRILAAFHPENRTWLLFQRVGSRPVGVIGYLGLGRWRVHFTRLDPRRAERLSERAGRRRRRRRRLVPIATKPRRG